MAGYSTTMTKEVLLLGLLKKKPMYGYEIKQLVDEELTNFAPVSSGSLYHNLKALEKKGLVTKTVVKDSAHPEKQIFHITSRGVETFEQLIRSNVTNFERPSLSLDVSLYFLEEAGTDKFLDHLRELLARLKTAHSDTERLRDELVIKGALFHIVSIPEHYLAHSRAEIGFLTNFIENMEKGREKLA